MIVFAATKNAGKLAELRAIFAPLGWDIRTADFYADPIEGADSYTDNAAAKARALRSQFESRGRTEPTLGDDSGLEVRSLQGRPGVLSARYGGEVGWEEKRRLLLAEVDAFGDERAAAFVCALHYIDVAGRESHVLARLPGSIATAERGGGGFSYDPIFVYEPASRTFAELDESTKNAVSHRARAARALAELLAAQAAAADSEK